MGPSVCGDGGSMDDVVAEEPSDDLPDAPSDECNSYCKDQNDGRGYCKWWQNPPVCKLGDQPCGPSVCAGGDTPDNGSDGESDSGDENGGSNGSSDTHDAPSDECNAYCQEQNGGRGYCKWWQSPSVCKHGDQPCGPAVCGDGASPDSGSDEEPDTGDSGDEGDVHDAPSDE